MSHSSHATAEPVSRTLSTAAASEYLGRAPVTLRKWRVAGCGPAYRVIRGQCLYDRADLDAFIEGHPRYRSTSERSALAAQAA